jgi:hypothetical protein
MTALVLLNVLQRAPLGGAGSIQYFNYIPYILLVAKLFRGLVRKYNEDLK